jgi:membrane-associated phospholipid phosphatase
MRALALTLILIAHGVTLYAQPAADDGHEDIPSIRNELRAMVGDVKSLASKETLVVTVAGAGATLAVHPLDDAAKVRLDRAESGTLHDVFYPGRILGASYTQLSLSAATYAFGRFTHRPRVARVGFELIRAQVISEGLVQGMKFTVRRERPDGSDSRSMPSGHAALTLASATVLQRQFGWVRVLPAYALASYVAASRVSTDKHFVSDVVAGGAIGVLVGRRVTRDDDRLASLSPLIGRGTVGLAWAKTW